MKILPQSKTETITWVILTLSGILAILANIMDNAMRNPIMIIPSIVMSLTVQIIITILASLSIRSIKKNWKRGTKDYVILAGTLVAWAWFIGGAVINAIGYNAQYAFFQYQQITAPIKGINILLYTSILSISLAALLIKVTSSRGGNPTTDASTQPDAAVKAAEIITPRPIPYPILLIFLIPIIGIVRSLTLPENETQAKNRVWRQVNLADTVQTTIDRAVSENHDLAGHEVTYKDLQPLVIAYGKENPTEEEYKSALKQAGIIIDSWGKFPTSLPLPDGEHSYAFHFIRSPKENEVAKTVAKEKTAISEKAKQMLDYVNKTGKPASVSLPISVPTK
jgi:hypothetical protein